MSRRRRNLGLVLLLLAGLCLPMRKLAAQSAAPKSAPMTATPQPKTYARRKKAAADPPAPHTSASPPTLEQTPPTPPQVIYNNGQLTIIARNATLSQVLRSVQSQTGAFIDMPSGASDERLVGQLGPGLPRDVLDALLNGSKFNYIILGVTGDPGAVQKVILTRANPAAPVNTARNNPVQPPDESQDDENLGESEPQPGPQRPLAPQPRAQAKPGRMPEGVNPPQPQPTPTPVDNSGDNPQPKETRTPEQLSQELQQMQQQQQQMLEQLNPANRKSQQ